MFAISLTEFITFLGTITLAAVAAHYLRLPTIVAFIFSGMALGPHGMGTLKTPPDAAIMAEIVAILLMFTIGLEFSIKKLRTFKREFLQLGLFQVTFTVAIIGVLSHYFLKTSWPSAVLLGCVVSLSSTALVLKILYDNREMETPYGRNAVGILLFQDVAVIPMMLAIPFLAADGSGLSDLWGVNSLIWFAESSIAVAGILVFGRYGMPLFMERIAKIGSREIFFFFLLFICLGTAYLFHHFGLSLSLGAFCAGMLISESPYGRQATAEILPLRDNFLGLLFASIGMLLNLQFLFNNLTSILLLGITLFALKLSITVGIGLLWKRPIKNILITSLSICQIGEFSFILASNGLKVGLIDEQMHQYFLSASILSMIFTPFLFKLGHRLALSNLSQWPKLSTEHLKTTQTAKQEPAPKKGHIVIIGFGIAGQNLATALSCLDIPFKVIETNYNTVKKYRSQNIPIDFGDASSIEVLEHAGLHDASMVVIAISGAKLIPSILHSIRSLRPDIRVVIRTQYIRDLEHLNLDQEIDIVVAEIETSVQLLAKSLNTFGVSNQAIEDYMQSTKQQLIINSGLPQKETTSSKEQAIDTLSSFTVRKDCWCTNKTLKEINLPALTGACLVSIFRQDSGITIPSANVHIREGDILYLHGNEDAIKKAQALLHRD